MSTFTSLDLNQCCYCGGFGIGPLQDIPGRTDWFVCLCKAGRRWRYARQVSDRQGHTHPVQPQWHVWAAEHNIPLRGDVLSGKAKDGRSMIDLAENWEDSRG